MRGIVEEAVDEHLAPVSLKDGSSILRRVLSSWMTALMRRRKNQRMPGASSSTPAAQAASSPMMTNSHSGTLTLALMLPPALHQDDVELLLSVAGFGLQGNRLADEVRKHGERAGFLVEEQVDHRGAASTRYSRALNWRASRSSSRRTS
jgi:hypothetical protein